MKKIFAIALALVMVLSMTAAFANTTCPTISWDCATYTCTSGTGSVEVVPYVKGNTCGGVGYAFTPSTCAGAVNSEDVYFAVKVTVDADANEDWWAQAALKVTGKGLDKFNGKFDGIDLAAGVVAAAIKAEAEVDYMKAGVYYIVIENSAVAAVKAADFDADVAGALWTAEVDNASVAKVCAKLTSTAVLTNFEVSGYKVTYNKDKEDPEAVLSISKGGKNVFVVVDADDKVVSFTVNDGTAANTYVVETYNADKTAFWATNKDEALSWTCNDFGKFLKAVMDAFKLDFGTCITDKAVKANFSWDDKVENCFSWSDKVQAVVDAECVVAIPKTGDASVLAWLF